MDRLPDRLESNARVKVSKAGVHQGTRREINLTSNDGTVTITGTDDGVNEKLTLDLSVPGAVGGPGGPPSGPAGGVLEGTYPNPGLAASVAGAGLSESSDVLSVNANRGLDVTADNIGITDVTAAGTWGSEYKIPQITVNTRGQVTSVVEKTVAAGSPISPSQGRAIATVTQSMATGLHDVDWTGVDFATNTGPYDFGGSSDNDAVPTLRITDNGVYAYSVQWVINEVDVGGDATYLNYLQSAFAVDFAVPILSSPSSDVTRVDASYQGSATWFYVAGTTLTFSVNHDASSSRSVITNFSIQRVG